MPIPEQLSNEVRQHLYQWALKNYPQLKGPELYELEQEMLDYFRGTGKGRKDWEATFRNWVIKHVRMSRPCRHCGVRPYEKPGTVPTRDPLKGSKGEQQVYEWNETEPTNADRSRAVAEVKRLREHLRAVR